LKLLHAKALVDDDWSRSGGPDPSWDSYSTAPLTSWPRFDLIDSAYPIVLLADFTPPGASCMRSFSACASALAATLELGSSTGERSR